MVTNFFKRELVKLQTNFNTAFGENPTFDLKLRETVLVAIIWLGLYEKLISQAKDTDSVRQEIKDFVHARDVLNDLFDRIQNQCGERSLYGEASCIDRRSRGLPALRKHLPGSASQAR